MRILLNQNSEAGGGAGQGADQQIAQGANGDGSQTVATPQPAIQPNTAQKLWGVQTEDKKGAQAVTQGDLTQGQSSATQSTPAPQAASKVELTEELLTKLGENIAKSVKDAQPTQPAQPPTMSQEEFDKMFNIYRPDEKLLAAILGEDKQVAVQALQTALHASAKQATTIASHLLEHKFSELQKLVAPALALAEERQQEQLKTEFFKAYPDLKGYEPLLVLIRDQMIATGRRFETKEKAFKAVAEEAAKHIASIPGLKTNGQSASGTQAGGQPAGQTDRRMPTLSGAKGQSGAGDASSSGGASGKKSTAERIFG